MGEGKGDGGFGVPMARFGSNPGTHRFSGLFGDLELDRVAGLLLHRSRAGAHRAVQRDIANLEAE